jgi:DNA-directed RNA polymerase subunit RPC12/RpoP
MKDKTSLQALDKDDSCQTDGQAGFRCDKCGEQFQKPLFTSISSEGLVRTYYACPRCLSKVTEVEEKGTDENEAQVQLEQAEGAQPKPETEKCPHFLGYLKKRPKETAIPEGCLTCERIIECMAH